MRFHFTIPMVFLVGSSACRAPEAPQEYEDLVGYIFEHAGDEEETLLLAGLSNLANWMEGDNLTSAEGGLTIENLPDSAVADLSGHDHTTDGLAGVSLVTESQYCSETLMDALTQYSFASIMPSVYTTYDREFEAGQECIVAKDCLWAEGHVTSVADWGLLGQVEAERRIEYRWVDTPEGWVFLQRWWLTEPSTGSALNLVIDDQYYIGINYPLEHGTQRVHASWLIMEMSTGDASTGAANQLIDNWKNDAEELDAWISDNL